MHLVTKFVCKPGILHLQTIRWGFAFEIMRGRLIEEISSRVKVKDTLKIQAREYLNELEEGEWREYWREPNVSEKGGSRQGGRLQDTLDEERVLDGLPQLVHRNKGEVSVLPNEL